MRKPKARAQISLLDEIAVCPQMAAAVVRANLPEWAVELNTMDELNRVIAV